MCWEEKRKKKKKKKKKKENHFEVLSQRTFKMFFFSVYGI